MILFSLNQVEAEKNIFNYLSAPNNNVFNHTLFNDIDGDFPYFDPGELKYPPVVQQLNQASTQQAVAKPLPPANDSFMEIIMKSNTTLNNCTFVLQIRKNVSRMND